MNLGFVERLDPDKIFFESKWVCSIAMRQDVIQAEEKVIENLARLGIVW